MTDLVEVLRLEAAAAHAATLEPSGLSDDPFLEAIGSLGRKLSAAADELDRVTADNLKLRSALANIESLSDDRLAQNTATRVLKECA